MVASEILRQPTVITRAAAIEKWAAVADICRCIHNYNSVLEITSALMNSSVYRLKKVWDKVNRQVGIYTLSRHLLAVMCQVKSLTSACVHTLTSCVCVRMSLLADSEIEYNYVMYV